MRRPDRRTSVGIISDSEPFLAPLFKLTTIGVKAHRIAKFGPAQRRYGIRSQSNLLNEDWTGFVQRRK